MPHLRQALPLHHLFDLPMTAIAEVAALRRGRVGMAVLFADSADDPEKEAADTE